MNVFVAILVNWAILALGLFLAAALLPGMRIRGGASGHLVVAALYGLLMAGLGWCLFGAIGFATLGLGFLFSFVTRLVVGAILLIATDKLSERLWLRGFGSAFIAATIVALVGLVGDAFVNGLLH